MAILPVVLPKEKHHHGWIHKFMTIQVHPATALCPVVTLQEYISCLPPEEALIPHHKDSGVLIHPLVHDRQCNISKAIGPDTINRHIGMITDLLE